MKMLASIPRLRSWKFLKSNLRKSSLSISKASSPPADFWGTWWNAVPAASSTSIQPLASCRSHACSLFPRQGAVHNLSQNLARECGAWGRAREHPRSRLFSRGTKSQGAHTPIASTSLLAKDSDESFLRSARTSSAPAYGSLPTPAVSSLAPRRSWTAASTRCHLSSGGGGGGGGAMCRILAKVSLKEASLMKRFSTQKIHCANKR